MIKSMEKSHRHSGNYEKEPNENLNPKIYNI